MKLSPTARAIRDAKMRQLSKEGSSYENIARALDVSRSLVSKLLGPKRKIKPPGRRKRLVTVPERVAELVSEHGGYRQAAAVLGVDSSWLHKLATKPTPPHPDSLRKLGLNHEGAVYERL